MKYLWRGGIPILVAVIVYLLPVPDGVEPTGMRMLGIFLGTITQMHRLAEQDTVRLTDYLNAMAPGIGNPLRVMEAAANGASITSEAFWSGGLWGDGQATMRSATKRGMETYEPTNAELAMQAVGLRPLRAALDSDRGQVLREETADYKRKVSAYLNRIIEEDRNRPSDLLTTPQAERMRARIEQRIEAIAAEADREGVSLTGKQIREAIRNADRSQAERDLRATPRALRQREQQRQRAIEERFQPAR